MIPIIKPVFGAEEEAAVIEALRSGWVTQGPRVAAFEVALAAAVGSAQCVAVTSATTALHLALHLCGLGPGDDVLVPSLSFIATTNAIWMVGAHPVFVDVAQAEPNVTAEAFANAWTPQTRAVLAVHQLGVPADRAGLQALCRARGVPLIEDAACAIGSLCGGQAIAAGAALSVFSFHPRKVLTMGEGGAIATDNPAYAERLRQLRHHGMSLSDHDRHGSAAREQYLEPGFNYRMTDLQAAVGLVQLQRLTAIVDERRALAQRYDQLLAGVQDVTLMPRNPDNHWNVQTYCVRIGKGATGREAGVRRDRVLSELNRQGIGARRGVMAAHQEHAWRHHDRAPLPHTEAWAAESLALPVCHGMTEAEQGLVVSTLLAAL